MTTTSAREARNLHHSSHETPHAASDEPAGGDPMRGLAADEIVATREVLASAGLVSESTRFVYVGVDEPAKAAVLAGEELPRIVRAIILDQANGASHDVRVSLTAREVVRVDEIDGSNGQAPILDVEFEAIYDMLGGEDEWHAALAKRGITHEQVALAPLSAGNYGFDDERGRRVIRVLAFMRQYEADHCWAHPVDGLCAYVDMIEGRMFKLVDHKVFDIPTEGGNFDDPDVQGAPLDTLKPISITQPEGPSFTVEGDEVVVGELEVLDRLRRPRGTRRCDASDSPTPTGGAERDVIYRASIAEMVVPYGDPSPSRFWQNYFDTGEYLLRQVRELARARLRLPRRDPLLRRDPGRRVRQSPGHPERDLHARGGLRHPLEAHRHLHGLAARCAASVASWSASSRRSATTTTASTGTSTSTARSSARPSSPACVFTSAYDPKRATYASEVAPGLGAPYHQHLFSARLDMMVDGVSNAVDEVDAVRLPIGEGNEYGNAFTQAATRDCARGRGRARRRPQPSLGPGTSSTPRSRNRLGQPVGLRAAPPGHADAHGRSRVVHRQARGLRDRKHLWVTQYAPDGAVSRRATS